MSTPNTVTVYRFEDADGRGPWRKNGDRLYNDHQRTRCPWHQCGDMPGPMGESPDTDLHKHWMAKGVKGMVFAFTSLRQLKLSFPSSVGRAAMAAVGQRLVKMEVPAACLLRGERQCVFPKGKATIVGVLDLKTLKETEQ